jgi:nucleotide-binding universal stress UspA family protein
MFDKILHASDGSKHAFHALTLALAIAKQNKSELHMAARPLPFPGTAASAYA